jgi:hypothetical protein
VSPRGRLSPPALPLSPSTAAVGLQLNPENPDAIMHIAQGLLATIRKREADHRSEMDGWCEQMAVQKIRFKEALARAQPTENQPEGYVRNVEGRAPNFIIPVEDGYFQPAWWVKQLADGRVVGLLKLHELDQTPHIAKVYAECDGDDDDENPVLPMPPWVLALFKGSTTMYAALTQQTREKGDWPLQAKVARYRELEVSLVNTKLRIEHLQAERRGMQEAQEASCAHLELARLDRKVSNLRTMAPDTHNRGFRGHKRVMQFRGNLG